MTKPIFDSVLCGVCGASNEVAGLLSTNRFGRMDLDTRPPPMARHTLWYQMSQCESCGYAAKDIAQVTAEAKELVRSDQYRATFTDQTQSPLLRRFACAAFLADRAGFALEAGWTHLSAAWVADDDKDVPHANEHRVKALESFLDARAANESFGDEPIFEEFLLIDILRRVGRFEEAGKRIASARSLVTEPFFVAILDLQQNLIMSKDMACHQVPEM